MPDRKTNRTRPVRRRRRRAPRVTMLPPGTQCENPVCGSTDAVYPTANGNRCYECILLAAGRPAYELDHPFDAAILPDTVRTPANFHRQRTEAGADWPSAVLNNVDRRPALLLAGFLLYLRDVGGHLVDWCQRFADWLLSLHDQLQASSGAHYETTLRLRPLFPTR